VRLPLSRYRHSRWQRYAEVFSQSRKEEEPVRLRLPFLLERFPTRCRESFRQSPPAASQQGPVDSFLPCARRSIEVASLPGCRPPPSRPPCVPISGAPTAMRDPCEVRWRQTADPEHGCPPKPGIWPHSVTEGDQWRTVRALHTRELPSSIPGAPKYGRVVGPNRLGYAGQTCRTCPECAPRACTGACIGFRQPRQRFGGAPAISARWDHAKRMTPDTGSPS
jgi:hypothetical protein